VFFGFLHGVLVKCSDVSEEHNAVVFRVMELVWLDAEFIQKKTFFFKLGQFEVVCQLQLWRWGEIWDCPQSLGLKSSRTFIFM
jgi:hypothetical protein